MKNVIVIEGPAGAGKTSLLTELARRFPQLCSPDDLGLPSIPKPDQRHYGDLPALSLLKDLQKLLAIWECPSSKVLVLDRFIMSAVVYATLRGRAGSGSHFVQFLVLRHAVLLDDLESLMASREAFPDDERGRCLFTLRFIVLLPTVEELRARRRVARRSFPYDAELEHSAYLDVLEQLRQSTLSMYTLHVVSSTEEAVEVVARYSPQEPIS